MAVNINSWTDLQNISNDLAGDYVLQSDLSSSDGDYTGIGDNFTPLGDNNTNFTGTFDGNGYTISDLVIDKSSTNYIGLFGYTDATTTIENVGLHKVKIRGNEYVGSLLGVNNGIVQNCYSAAGSVVATTSNAGGLIGTNQPGGTVTDCFSTVNVYCNGNNSGGLIGRSYENITNCYTTGKVGAGTYQHGGLIGYAADSLTITNSFSTSPIFGSEAGGLVGDIETYSTVTFTDCGWYTGNYDDADSIDNDGTSATYETSDKTDFYDKTHSIYNNWDFTTPDWYEQSDFFPTLTSAKPDATYEIDTWTKLQNIEEDKYAGYSLSDNLSSSTGDYPGTGDDFTPIGSDGLAFYGSFNGKGYKILDLTINNSSLSSYGGFICKSSYSFLVERLALENIDMTFNNASSVGSIIGSHQRGIIKDCYVTGSITTSGGRIGGLIGTQQDLYTEIVNCYFAGDAVTTADARAGGIVGDLNAGSVINCYVANGSLTCDNPQDVWNGYIYGDIDVNGSTVNCWYSEEFTITNNGSGSFHTDGATATTNDSDFYDKTQDVYDLNSPVWDFGTTWYEYQSDFPKLEAEEVPQLDLEVSDTLNITDSKLTDLSQLKKEIEDGINLNDDYNLDLSQLKYQKDNSINISDKIVFNQQEVEEIDDTANLTDDIEKTLNIIRRRQEVEEDTSLSDSYNLLTFHEEKDWINQDIRTVKEVINDFDSQINTAREITTDFNNQIKIVLGNITNINNKSNTAIENLNDPFNLLYFIRQPLSTVNNDIRSMKQVTPNVSNDFRMLTSSQVPGDAGFQSLGKEYIKVYFDSIEVTDVDIDSIKITRNTNNSSTATFTLARAYDSTKPDQETKVEIKYDGNLLYTGYIVQITPSDNPDSMTINCEDKAWLDDRTQYYFSVGHGQEDEDHKWYTKIYDALNDIWNLTWNIGDFVPQDMSLYGNNKFSSLVSLIEACGNYEVYYDVNENLKLKTIGSGSLVELEAQELDENLNLHNVLTHNFNENVKDLINRYYVQMGNEITSYSNTGTVEDTGTTKEPWRIKIRDYKHIIYHPKPRWIEEFKFQGFNPKGGYDYHNPDGEEPDWKYSEVFVNYSISDGISEYENWSDVQSPTVYLYDPSSLGYDKVTHRPGWMYDGFSIDFEHALFSFSQPVYYERWYTVPTKDDKIEKRALEAIRRAKFVLHIWKETYRTIEGYTPNSTYSSAGLFREDYEGPNYDEINEYSLWTEKWGNYSETVTGYLNLSGYSKQDGLSSKGRVYGNKIIPSWDDEPLAKDMAYWKLSQTCDKKITGKVNITLDTLTFYNIDLNNRIKVKNIQEEALNVTSFTIDISSWTVSLNLENGRTYKRSVSVNKYSDARTTGALFIPSGGDSSNIGVVR